MDMRRILSLVLAIVMMVSLCPTQTFAAEVEYSAPVSGDTVTEIPAEPEVISEEGSYPTLEIGEKTLAELPEGGTAYFTFTPDVTCTYLFTSHAAVDTYGCIYDADWNELAYDDDGGENTNFGIVMELTEGQTYILGARYLSNESGCFDISVVHADSNSVVTREPVCNASGEAEYICNICGAAWTQEVFVAHNYALVENKNANCTEEGYTVYECVDCGDRYTEVHSIWHDYANDICQVCGQARTASGVLNETTCWELNLGTDTLTISGTGATPDGWSWNNHPWHLYYYGIRHVVVEEGITRIGDGLLADLEVVESVSLPSTLTEIGNNGFFSARSLQEIILPDGLTTIGQGAFSGCRTLEELVIPNSVTEMGTFSSCSGLRRAVVGEGVTALPAHAFDQCVALEEVVLPSGLKSIDEFAFYGCVSMKTIELPEGLEYLGNSVFSMSGLETIMLPASLRETDCNPFGFCDNLQYIDVAAGSEHFVGINGVLYSNSGATLQVIPGGWVTFRVPDYVTEICNYAFSTCRKLQSLIFTGDAINASCAFESLVTIYYPADNETWTQAVKDAFIGPIEWMHLSDLMILAHPVPTETEGGMSFTMSVLVQGTDVSYQWQVSTNHGSSWNNIPGANSDVLELTAKNEDDGNYYRCVVTDADGNELISRDVLLEVISTAYVSQLYTTHYVNTDYGHHGFVYFTPVVSGTYYFAFRCGTENIAVMDAAGNNYYSAQGSDNGYYCFDLEAGETLKLRISSWDSSVESHAISVLVKDRPTLIEGHNYVSLMYSDNREYVFMPEEDGTYVIYNDYMDPFDLSVAELDGDAIEVDQYIYNSQQCPGYVMELKGGHTYVLSFHKCGENTGLTIQIAKPTPAYDLYTNRYDDLTGMVGSSADITVFTNTATAARPNLVWETSDPNVATVEAVEGLTGRLNFIGEGSCIITITDTDTGVSTDFGVNVTQPVVLAMGDNELYLENWTTRCYAFTAEEAGTYVVHLPRDSYYWSFKRMDEMGNLTGTISYSVNDRYGISVDLDAGETFYFGLCNEQWGEESCNKTLTVAFGQPVDRIAIENDCISGALGGSIETWHNYQDILHIGAKFTAVSDDESVVKARMDQDNRLILDFLSLGTCHVTVTSTHFNGETISKTFTVKTKEVHQLTYGEHSVELMWGETEYYCFTPEESGYYVIYFPDLTEHKWNISAGQYDYWANEYYNAAGCVGFRFWLDAGVEARINVDNWAGQTDTQRFVFAQATDATGIRLSQTEITGKVEEYVQLTAEILPETFVYDEVLFWESSNENVVGIGSYWNQGRNVELRLYGPGTATVRVYNDNLGIEAFVTVNVEPSDPLSLGENTRFVSSWGGETFFYFCPEVSGDYVLTYTHGHAHIQHVQTLDGTYPAQRHDTVGDVYVRTATLEAGVWYRWSAFAYMDSNITFSLNLADETTGITLEQESVTAMVGVPAVIYAHLQPMTSQVNDLTWESSNEEIFTVEESQSFSYYATINPVGAGEATLTVRTEEGIAVSIPVIVTMPPALELGENQVAVSGWSTGTYAFTAPADGTYILSWPNAQGWPDVWPASYEDVNWVDLYEYGYFAYSMTMTAGQSCLLYVQNSSSWECSWTMTVAPAQAAETISIVSPRGNTGYVGTSLTLYADVHPGAAAQDGLTWTLSNENIGMVVPNGDYQASVYLVAGGFADVIVTTDSGLTATYRIHSELPEAWLVDESKEVTLDPGKQTVYTFTPKEDGWYVLYYGEEHVSYDLMVTDGNGDEPSYSIHSSGNLQAHRMLLMKGETYYLALYHDAGYEETATRTMTLAKATAVESVTVTPDQDVYAVGDHGYVGLEQNPITAVDSMVDLICNNPDVLQILGVYSDGFDFHCSNAGVATVTMIYESGYTTSVEITVSDYPSLWEGNFELFIPIGEEQTYLFTPEQSGLYGLTTWYNPWWTTVTTTDGKVVERTDYVRYGQFDTRRGYLFELEEGVTYQITVWNNYHGDTASDGQWFSLLPEVPAESIELNTHYMELSLGGIGYLMAEVAPFTAYTAEVRWLVEDESIVTIDEYGDVRAVGVGTTTITAVCGDVSASCTVTVCPPEDITEGTWGTYMEAWGGSATYRFVPEVSGTYVIALDEGIWGMMMLDVYEDGVQLHNALTIYKTARHQGQSVYLTAGKEYLLSFTNYNEWDYGGGICVYRAEPLQSVYGPLTVSGYVGHGEQYYLYVDPLFAVENLTVESSNPDVVSVDYMFNHSIYMDYLSAGTATVTVTASNGASATITVHVAEVPTLNMGELVDISMTRDEAQYYRFTVEEAGVYVLAMPSGDFYYEVWDVVTRDHPTYSDNYTENYLFAVYVLDPGTYELMLAPYENVEGQVGIGPKVVSQTLDISQHELILNEGFGGNLFAILDSPFAIAEEVVWTSANEDVVVVYPQDVGGVWAIVRPMGLGTTTVTATLGEKSVTCTVTVEAIPELTEGEEVTVTSDEAGQTHYFTFTPQTTGVYTFVASRSDVLLDLIDEYVCASSGGLLMELYKGNTYTIAYRILNGGTGTFDVAVKAGTFCGMNATWSLENGTLTISGTGDMFDYNGESLADIGPWINYQDEITKVVISDGITSIGDLAFLDLLHVKTVTIPASVASIGELAFANWYSMETVIFEGDAPAIAENAFAECYFVNMVYPAGNETWIEDVMQDYCGNDIFWSDGQYLTFRYLQNEGFGFFTIEEEMFVFTEMETFPGSHKAVIFYSNIWDGQKWTVTPVEVQGNEFVTLSKIMDVEPDNIGDGAKHPEYYYFLDVTEDSWEQNAAVSFATDSGRILSVPIIVSLPNFGFYSEPEISTENMITYFEWDPDSTEDRVFYFGYIQDGEWALVDVDTEDMEGWPLSGHEFVTLEALENGMYKITVSQEAPDGFWLELFITLQNPEGQVSYRGHGGECHVGQSTKPYLTIYDLNWSEDGWYLEGEHRSFDSFNLTPGACRIALFTINYVNENGEWVEEPVEIRWTDGLTVTKLQDVENALIAPGAKYSQYYYKIEVNGWNLEETLFYELNGEKFAVGVDSYLPRYALYSEPIVSTEYFLYDCLWDPNSNESRDFYFGMSGKEVVSFTLSPTDPAGNPMPGTEYVTLTRLDNGMYKITVSAEVEEAFYLELWLTEVYADGSLGEGNTTIICAPAEDYRCGDDAYWAFDEVTGTLTISGTGAIYDDFFAGEDLIKHVVIGEGITSIGSGIFSDCTELISVTLPNTLTEIPIGAFYGTGLVELVIPEGVTSIGMSAFEGCASLTSVNLPGTLTEIGTAAFCNCTGLTSVKLPEGLLTLGTGAFQGCSSLTDVSLPESLGVIWGNAFAKCTSLTSITIPSGVEAMYWTVFTGCTALREITFQGIAPSNTLDGDTYPVLEGITATVYYPGDEATWTEEVKQSYGGNITWIPVYPTSGQCGTSVYWSFDPNSGLLLISGYGAMDEHAGSPSQYPWYPFKDEILEVDVGEGVTNVADFAFYDYTNLQLAWLNVESVGGSAFMGCVNLTDVVFSDYLTAIGDGAFADTGIVNIYLPDSLTSVGGEAFYGSKLTSVVIPGTVTEWGNGAFQECLDLKDATFGAGITAVPSYIFVGCTSLETVVFPESVTSIGWCSFKGCTSLTNVVLPDGLQELQAEAFGDCVSLTSIEIPASVERMLKPFKGCTGLAEITFLGDAPMIVDSEAFAGVNATVYYPGGNDTWTEEVMQQYGGTLTWVAVGNLNGWVSENGSWYYYVDNVKQTGWQMINGYWYYMDSDGVMQTGWVKVGANWYYMSTGGVMQTGWVSVGGKWYYMSSGGVMQTGWVYVGSNWYYFASGGAMQTGWLTIGSNKYYLHSSGAMAVGLTEINGSNYYFASSGVMQTGWQTVDGVKYLFNSDGAAAASGWYKDNGNWYYLNADGSATTGWLIVGNNKYYMDADGIMQTGLQTINGTTYFFASGGAMQTGWQTVNGVAHLFGSDGAAVTGWYKENNSWYYLDSTGAKQTGWLTIGSNRYYMNDDGVMQTGWLQYDGKWYYLASGGAMQTGWAKVGSYWYYMDANGVMTTGWVKVGGSWYYMNKSGVMQTGWVKVGNYWYYMNSSGVMLTGTQTIDGKTYIFNDSGVWIG